MKTDQSTLLRLLLLAGFASASGCANVPKTAISPLSQYMSTYDFELFSPPRSGDGIGTIIKFEAAQESIVFRRDRCLPAPQVPSLDEGARSVAMLQGSYEIDQSATLELGISRALMTKALGAPIDLSTAIGTNGIKKIKIAFVEPYRDAIEKGRAKDVVRAYAKGHTCLEEFARSGNLVIHTVLGAKGIQYSFVGEGGNSVQITAALLDQLKVSPEFKNKWNGQLGFDVAGDVLIGYRAWKAMEVSGAFDNPLELIDLSSTDVSTLKKAAAK